MGKEEEKGQTGQVPEIQATGKKKAGQVIELAARSTTVVS